MDKRGIREMLAAHADQLVGPGGSRRTRHDQVQGLLDLAEQLQGVLVPVEPDANFRRRLHGELILEAQRRPPYQRTILAYHTGTVQRGEAEPGANLFQQHRKGILIGAAAVGSVASVVGVIIAFVLRHRQGRATHIATG